MISFRILAVVILANCFYLVSFAQSRPQPPSLHRNVIQQNDSIRYVIDPGVRSAERTETALDTMRVIVRLKTSPRQETAIGRIMLQEIIAGEHLAFRSLLKETQDRINSLSGPGHQTKILFEYRQSINGFAMETTRAVAETLRQQKSVSSVAEDKVVRTTDETSNDVIKATHS